MYQVVDGKVLISVSDWLSAGLTADQFKKDSSSGFLEIYRRGYGGNTLIDVESIKRSDRMKVIEAVYGSVDEVRGTGSERKIYDVTKDASAREFYLGYRTPSGEPLTLKAIDDYVSRASIFNAMREGMQKQIEQHAACGERFVKGMWWKWALGWHTDRSIEAGVQIYSNERSLERAFKSYCTGGYASLISKAIGNDNARIVSADMQHLFLALWRTNDKPFVGRVHQLYLEFVSGSQELYDKSTGEVFRPEDFRYKGRALEVSKATVWGYLKDVVNNTLIFSDRNGNFDYANSRRPKNHRHLGQYSLSKISMDDVALSRQSTRGWVYKYIAVDVVSGYYFRPAYQVGKPTLDTVMQAFRNMFCELDSLGLPIPGELEVEHHLMKDMDWLNEVFPMVRFCTSPTEKRAEHNIRSLKYGTAKDNGHTLGRWYAKSEAFRCVRNKVDGDYVTEQALQPQTIVADDLADIEAHNNELHPLRKTYPGMTRKEVFISRVNKALKPLERWYLYRYIGNCDDTTIRNNDYVKAANAEFELKDFADLRKLEANNLKVQAYWLPKDDGSVDSVYLYQGDKYIGEATNRTQYDYNECAIERTDGDREKMLHQYKRATHYDKFIKDNKSQIPHIGRMSAGQSAAVAAAPLEVVETEQPKGYEEDEFTKRDWGAKAIDDL